jgi:hypothetical protein
MAARPTDHPVACGMLTTFTAPYTYRSHYYTETSYYAMLLRHIFMFPTRFLVVPRGIPFRCPPGLICVPSSLLSGASPIQAIRAASHPSSAPVCLPITYITVTPLSYRHIPQIAYFFVRAQIVLGAARSGRSRGTEALVFGRTCTLTTLPRKPPFPKAPRPCSSQNSRPA